MIHEKEWVATKYLLGVGGLPSTLAGLHKRAKNEGWQKRSITVPGVRGRTFAYRLQDLPLHVQSILGVEGEHPVKVSQENQNTLTNELVNIIETLTKEEQEKIIYILRRKGVEQLIDFCNEENQELISLTGVRRLAALSLKNWTEERIRESFEESEAETNHFNLTDKQASA
ncbi:DNA-binding protein [Salmonella enterica]|uniref:DNA-binding protein n=1 Tax=Salmonella enterica TaxID=28901 RepID=UPI0012C36601|nr:DNA-binding protein [Salmonella enterica]EEJ1462044.1 DNA-binding protein [Salmonella enterica subsp. enterica serovar Virginia]EGN8530032.1 DNA-binding protein [Salmonella enterica]EHW0708140.1 DNA-binding protein [Salmonella enterica]EHX6273819.1 DNA-binding protein [Salmonella enterica]